MNEHNHIPDAELLARFLSGEAMPEEAMIITEHSVTASDKEVLNSLLFVWSSNTPSPFSSLSPEKAWDDLWVAIQEKSARKRVINLRWLAAACVFLIIGLGILLLWPFARKEAASPVISLHAGSQVIQRQLPDGSRVVLHKKSSLHYPSGFNAVARNLELEGQSFFNVVPDKKRPFIISVGQLKIKVVGTSFDVKQAGDTAVVVQVHSGIVEMSSGEKKLMVPKGQRGTYNVLEDAFILADGTDVNSTSYATKDFSFNNLPLPEVARLLEDAFGVKVSLANTSLQYCRLTSDFHHQSLTYILDIVSTTVNGSFKKTGNQIYLYGKGCND